MGTIIGLVCFGGFVLFGVLYILFFLKGGLLKLPVAGMAVFFLLVVAVGALTHFGIGPFGDGTADDSTEPTGSVESQDVGESDPIEPTEPMESGGQEDESEQPEEDDSAIKSGSYTLPCGMNIQFFDSVRNDVTGNWRRATTSNSYVPADYALEYYHEMFSDDSEIHGIWNATLKTTTCIKVMSGLLFVDTHEYVDGEEHDANLMFSGMVLDSRIINIETGEPYEG